MADGVGVRQRRYEAFARVKTLSGQHPAEGSMPLAFRPLHRGGSYPDAAGVV